MNKKHLIILIVICLLSTTLISCNSNKGSLLENGRIALENNNYSQAKKYLSEVLEEDSKNEQARAMYMQASKMASAQYYKEQGLYDKSIKSLEYIVNIENGSKKIKIESKELKKEVESLQEEQEEAANIRKENAKQVAKKAVEESEKDFYAWQKNQENDSENDSNSQNDQNNSSSPNIIDGLKNLIGGLLNF